MFPAIVELNIEGWSVRVEKALAESGAWSPVRREIENELYRIGRVVPDAPLAKLREITIWVNLNDPATPCAAYHPGADWLRDHGANPEMAKGIEVGNAANFVSWTYEQPWMLLHELAHAYHDRFLAKGFENDDVKGAYQTAVSARTYEKVRHWNGGESRHYALENPMEFFAETTEAYFGQNDFFPFVNAELKGFDPAAYTLMVQIWGQPQKRR